ncbi:protein kinase [Nocardia sp. CA2R105]|uniref:serine/threonine-protein kinase n=1 Tax=Nocardia coffeae TaxID=2873381 RepID=UPI001CA79FBD|nr:serine/threonine-protein kinase [Nocardia coffeae]MBY8862003.1 protein kinase [Nocardia coffeae]
MTTSDETTARREFPSGIAAELADAGFGEAEEVGRGGFGTVYRCVEYALERYVAVKVLMPNVSAADREQFLREQRALGRLSGHPHILQVLRADITASGRPYLVMPFYARGSLDQRLHAAGSLSPADVLSIGVKIAGSLAAAHSIGILHRDVKPDNILLTDYEEPQLADFGIAQFGDATTASTSLIQGTPAFTAPELLNGAGPSPASDIYGLAATLFCLLSGRPAFARRTGEPLAAQLSRILTGPIPDLRRKGIPSAVCEIAESAMSAKPEDRPKSATEFGERLREVQKNSGWPVDVVVVPPATSAAVVTVSTPQEHSASATAAAMPPPIAVTKFKPPSTARTAIERSRLLSVLRRGGSRQLTLISGPAGFGKTTLATQWGRALESENISVAWFTADSDDNNVVWFLNHLIETIRRARPQLAGDLGALLEERYSDAAGHMVSTLIDEIHQSGRETVLIVDDWHHINSRATLAAMEYLLERGCHHLRIVITSRTRGGLPLSRMLLKDELLDIDARMLRFDPDESRAFLLQANDLPLTADDVARLQSSTEGWPAALQLATLMLRGNSSPATFIEGLTGHHHVIAEYLAENVLDALEPETLDFLSTTSITDRICAPLAAALSNVGDSQARLEEIADRNLFLRRLDDNSEWFRYHRLFADYLQRRMMRENPARLAQLHLRASDWLAEHGSINAAIDHALAADDPQRAVALVDACALELLESSRMATLLGLVAKLPAALTDSHPGLQLCIAWANCGLQREVQTNTALAHVRTVLERRTVTAERADVLRLEASMVDYAQRYVTDRFYELPTALIERVEHAPTPFTATCAANLATIDAWNRFDYSAARHWQEWAAPYRRQRRGPFGLVHGLSMAGLACLEQLDTESAEQYFRTAMELTRRDGAQTHSSLLAGALLGEVRYEQGRLEEADRLLDSCLNVGCRSGPVDFLMAIYGTGARVKALRGNRAAAVELLAEGAKTAAEQSLPRLAARIVNEHIRLGLPISETARFELDNLPRYRSCGTAVQAGISELQQDSIIRLLLAQQTNDASGEAVERAQLMVRLIGLQNRPKALAQAQLRFARCLSAAGRPTSAKQSAGQVFSQCIRAGLPRLALDEGPNGVPQTAEVGSSPRRGSRRLRQPIETRNA